MPTQQEPLAKPSGITIADHTRHVVEECGRILEAYPFLAEKYRRLTGGGDLAEMLGQAAADHDLGKKHPRWQRACRADYAVYRRWRGANGHDPDGVERERYAEFEAAVGRGAVKRPGRLMKAGLRHEIASLMRMPRRSPEVYAAVAAHHGKLSARHEHRWREDGREEGDREGPFYPLYKQFKVGDDANDRKKADALSLAAVLRKRYRFDAIRALLQFADTRASRMESLERAALSPLERWRFTWPREWYRDGAPSYRPVQREALAMAESDEFVTILRAPTGSGKTAAAMLWADRQVRRGRADRLVVAMPTRFTANALAKSAEDLAGATGLYHSTAFFTRYEALSDAEKSQARETHLMAQRLATPTTVCTIDHLLLSLSGVRESHHATFFFLANAAVVLDEADFYDAYVQANLRCLLDALRALEVPVLIMSATVPESARTFYGVGQAIVDVDAAEAAEREPPVRRVRYGGEAAAPADQRELLAEMLRRGNGIVYANTVARAMAYRRYLRELQRESDPDSETEIVLYHSRFTEPHKREKEERLEALLGPGAWAAGDVNAIAVLTQIGEMSINISTSLMLSEVCPWDRLSQRLGRLNRFRRQTDAECVVVAPMKDGALYPAPYGEYVRGEGWQESEPLSRTLDMLKGFAAEGQYVTPVEMTGYVNELYRELEALTPAARRNVKAYEELIRSTMLILPDVKSDDDTGEADTWSARQIGPQATVLTKVPPHLGNWGEWQAWKLRYGLEVPVYQVEKDQRQPVPKLTKGAVAIGWKDEPDEVGFYHTPLNDEDAGVLAGSGDEVYNAELGLYGIYDLGTRAEDLADDDG